MLSVHDITKTYGKDQDTKVFDKSLIIFLFQQKKVRC